MTSFTLVASLNMNTKTASRLNDFTALIESKVRFRSTLKQKKIPHLSQHSWTATPYHLEFRGNFMIFLTFYVRFMWFYERFFGFSLIVKTKQEDKMKLLIFSISMQCERNEWENPHPTSPSQPFPSSTLCGKYFHIVSGRGKVFFSWKFRFFIEGEIVGSLEC